MRPIVCLAAVIMVVVSVSACDVVETRGRIEGSGVVVDDERSVSGFNSLVVSGSAQIEMTLAAAESLVISTDDNLLDLIESQVVGGRLEIDIDSDADPSQDVFISISAVEMESVTFNGSAELEMAGFEGQDFSSVINGSGMISPSGVFGDLTATINGSGLIEPIGVAGRIDVAVNGSGQFRGEEIVVPIADVRISGSGHAYINATEELRASVNGSGSITYFGSPTLTSTIAGTGSVHPAG
jgi:hypothetical protein